MGKVLSVLILFRPVCTNRVYQLKAELGDLIKVLKKNLWIRFDKYRARKNVKWGGRVIGEKGRIFTVNERADGKAGKNQVRNVFAKWEYDTAKTNNHGIVG